MKQKPSKGWILDLHFIYLDNLSDSARLALVNKLVLRFQAALRKSGSYGYNSSRLCVTVARFVI